MNELRGGIIARSLILNTTLYQRIAHIYIMMQMSYDAVRLNDLTLRTYLPSLQIALSRAVVFK